MKTDIDVDFGTGEEKNSPVSFKDFVSLDNENVFFNDSEFAETHNIGGIDFDIVIDDCELQELQGGFEVFSEHYEKMLLFFIDKQKLGYIPKVNSNLFFDGEMWQVAYVNDDKQGVLEIVLGKNAV